jgi:hypothetical protein
MGSHNREYLRSLPSSALAVKQQKSDVPDDSTQPLFPCGFGMQF